MTTIGGTTKWKKPKGVLSGWTLRNKGVRHRKALERPKNLLRQNEIFEFASDGDAQDVLPSTSQPVRHTKVMEYETNRNRKQVKPRDDRKKNQKVQKAERRLLRDQKHTEHTHAPSSAELCHERSSSASRVAVEEKMVSSVVAFKSMVTTDQNLQAKLGAPAPLQRGLSVNTDMQPNRAHHLTAQNTTIGVDHRPGKRAGRSVDEREKFHSNFALLISAGERAMKRAEEVVSKESTEEQQEIPFGQYLFLYLRAWRAGLSLRSDRYMDSLSLIDDHLFRRRRKLKSALPEVDGFVFSGNQRAAPQGSNHGSITTISESTVCISDHKQELNTVPLKPFRQSVQSLQANRPNGVISGESLKFSLDYLELQRQNLQCVHDLLRSFDQLRDLYPSYRALKQDLKEEFTARVQDRINVLQVWYNVTRDLCRKIKQVGIILGAEKLRSRLSETEDHSRIMWPNLDYDSPSSDSDESGDSTTPARVQSKAAAGDRGRISADSLVIFDKGDCGKLITGAADLYSRFVEKSLRRGGMRHALQRIGRTIGNTCERSSLALQSPETVKSPASTPEKHAKVGDRNLLSHNMKGHKKGFPGLRRVGRPRLRQHSGHTSPMKAGHSTSQQQQQHRHTVQVVSPDSDTPGQDQAHRSSTIQLTVPATMDSGSSSGSAQQGSIPENMTLKVYKAGSFKGGAQKAPSLTDALKVMHSSVAESDDVQSVDRLSITSRSWSVARAPVEADVLTETLLEKWSHYVGSEETGGADLSLYGIFHTSFCEMNLVSFLPSFLFLLRIPLDLTHQWLRLRRQQGVEDARSLDLLTLNQLISDAGDVLENSVAVKHFYASQVQCAVSNVDEQELILSEQLDDYEADMQGMFEKHLDYVAAWAEKSYYLQTNVTNENRWRFAKRMAIYIRSGEEMAAKSFCIISQNILASIVNFLDRNIDTEAETVLLPQDQDEDAIEYEEDDDCSITIDCAEAELTPPEDITRAPEEQHGIDPDFKLTPHSDAAEFSRSISKQHHSAYEEARRLKSIISEATERITRAVTFSHVLRDDLEISIGCSTKLPIEELFWRLKTTRHVLVEPTEVVDGRYCMFVKEEISNDEPYLRLLLNVTCGRNQDDIPKRDSAKSGYLLIVRVDNHDDAKKQWWHGNENVKAILTDAETKIALNYISMKFDVLFVVVSSAQLKPMFTDLSQQLPNVFEIANERCSCHSIIASKLDDMKDHAMDIGGRIVGWVEVVSKRLNVGAQTDDNERTLFRDVILQAYKLAFEYYREVSALISSHDMYERFGQEVRVFALQWIDFAMIHCEEGKKKTRPEWASPGLKFLELVCRPLYSRLYADEDYNELRDKMNKCIFHVYGKRDGASASEPDFRKPSVTLIRTQESVQPSKSINQMDSSLVEEQDSANEQPSSPNSDESRRHLLSADSFEKRVLRRIGRLEEKRETRARQLGLTGRLVDEKQLPLQDRLGGKRVGFSWQLMSKVIGKGTTGVVNTALNLDTQQVMAVKQVQIDRRNHQQLATIVEEIKNFESIQHPNLVRYYGVEVYKDVLMIFMEFCNEGTLENLCDGQGLEFDLVRHFTKLLLTAVSVLHTRGIVHRDIKSANIFLSSYFEEGSGIERTGLKLGDFGCSVRIQSKGTITYNAYELTELRGTMAYMAPEVITAGAKSSATVGYGRPADVWSVGCVVLEMLTGKRPFHNMEDVMIMYQVGTNNPPPIPEYVSTQARDFLGCCFAIDPAQRQTVDELLGHTFANVGGST